MSTLKVDTILKRTGTGTITLGQSGDTIALGSGASQTGFGGTNTPSFYASLTTNVTISDNTITKIPFATEVWDTDNAYDNSSNYRFTVPSGEAGKYSFTFQGSMGIKKHYHIVIYLKKNGSTIGGEQIFTNGYEQSADNNIGAIYNQVLDLAVSDYVEIFVKINNNGTSSAFLHGDNFVTFFTGYKLIT
tara:strand:- start:59 stop:625 length:567 start_codon:yes stop_codon:yes gene_type:complete